MEIDIQLGNGVVVPGSAPLVLIGANSAGKTRFGTFIVNQFGYDRISALRGLSATEIPMWTPESAKQQTDSVVAQSKSNISDATGDLIHLLAELKAEESLAATTYRKKALETNGAPGMPAATRLDTLTRLWGLIFPGRALDITGYQPKASWTNGSRSADPYSISTMSDGERSALYLIARILRSPPGIVVVDEPEIHFHTLLARQFWNTIEAEKKNCRFVYITHDLNFAMSRRGRIGIVKGPNQAELIPDSSYIPADLFEGIVGAASLSVVANRIVLCEGDREKSVDISFYTAWFRSPQTVVVPVGSCEEVRRTFATFTSTDVIKNANPIAVIERDYWSEDYLDTLKKEGMHVLPAHEVEGLVSMRPIALAVANHLAVTNFDNRYDVFEQNVRKQFVGISLNKTILERAKREIDIRLLGLPNKAHPDKDLASTKGNLVTAVDLSRAVPDVGALFDRHSAIVTDAIAGSWEKFLPILPGKACFNTLVDSLGLKQETYLNLINEALLLDDTDDKAALHRLRIELVVALTPLMPPR